MALAAVRRIDALFDIERDINGQPAADRLAVRQRLSAPLVEELEGWMRQERAKFSRHNDVAQAMDYMLNRWPGSCANGQTCSIRSTTTRRDRRLETFQ